MSNIKKLSEHEIEVLKAFQKGITFTEIANLILGKANRSSAQWAVRKGQRKLNSSIDVVIQALENNLLTPSQVERLIETLVQYSLRQRIHRKKFTDQFEIIRIYSGFIDLFGDFENTGIFREFYKLFDEIERDAKETENIFSEMREFSELQDLHEIKRRLRELERRFL